MPREVHKTIHQMGNCQEQFADFLSSGNSRAPRALTIQRKISEGERNKKQENKRQNYRCKTKSKAHSCFQVSCDERLCTQSRNSCAIAGGSKANRLEHTRANVSEK
jgi:hypothetical protein